LQVRLLGKIVSTEINGLERSLLDSNDIVVDTYELVRPTLKGTMTTMTCIDCGDDQDCQ